MKEILQNNKLYIIGFFIAFEILNIYNFINLKMPPQVFELFTFDYCKPHTCDLNHELGEQNSQRI